MIPALDVSAGLRAVEAEMARRAVASGTVGLLRWRSDRYRPGRWHHQIGAVCDDIVAATMAGKRPRVMIGAPPGHGKTEHVGRGMPVLGMAREPGAGVFYVTSTDDRAEEVSSAAQAAVLRLFETGGYPHLEPGRKWATCNWTTRGGGGWIGSGWKSATGGIRGRYLILDDLTGSEDAQDSDPTKARMRRALLGDILTREAPGVGSMEGVGGSALVIMETRRGLDDLQGWVQTAHPGRVPSLTWQCMAEPGDPWGREPGEFLWPEGGFNAAWHAQALGLTPGDPVWEAQYQQRPIREGGETIREAWTSHRYPGDPLVVRRSADAGSVIIAVDCSAKTADRNDPTAIQVWGRFGRFFRCLYSEEIKPDDLTRHLKDLKATWRPDAIVLEDASIAPEIARQLQRDGVQGVILQTVAGKGDKVARMVPHRPLWMAGDIELPESEPWVAAFVAQLLAVPKASHDDLWDACTLALAWYASLTMHRAESFSIPGI